MSRIENFLQKKLNDRVEKGLLRKLTTTSLPFDFCSNDYLGFARSSTLKKLIDECQNIYKNILTMGFPNLLNDSAKRLK